ncbi:MAG: 2-C-methyl-D-erythritol 4-phosphate cytidylyltransferase [Pseudomonas sp.]
MTCVGAVIPAGGAGRRMGGQAKAELTLLGVPLLQRVLDRFLTIADVQHIVVAVPATLLADPPSWLTQPRVRLVPGGEARSDSVRNGLAALPGEVDTVVIHDGARPLVSRELIERVIALARSGIGAIAALPATDTIHVVDEQGSIVQTPERSVLWQAQTPQAFPRAVIELAHRRALEEKVPATDDAALVVRYGGAVEVVRGEPHNLKITVPADVKFAEALLAARV